MNLLPLILMIIVTWVVAVFHSATLAPPDTPKADITLRSKWIAKKENGGMHHLILKGTPFERGKAAGFFTKDLLALQEDTLMEKLQSFIPSTQLIQIFSVAALRWFYGMERTVEPSMLEEMYGVSLSAPTKLNHLLDPYTRQLAYHGIHEVGQMMVDRSEDDQGCTVIALKNKTGWILGRNFDFEGGRVFDDEKILKWVFPEKGIPYLSVIWAGMVGAVTGVNAHGIYVSINAAGSKDFRRLGMPTTLLVTKILETASSGKAALDLLKTTPVFITDIFVVLDSANETLFRVEKSPHETIVHEMSQSATIANHLTSPRWEKDAINVFRRESLTSHFREQRGNELLKNAEGSIHSVLSFLRDKGIANGQPLPLGNRRAIDALIATHSVIYDPSNRAFYVNEGPGVSGAFLGFDLMRSFIEQRPVHISSLPADPLVTRNLFDDIQQSRALTSQAERALKSRKCEQAKDYLKKALILSDGQSRAFQLMGDALHCLGHTHEAREAWTKALSLAPAYASHEKALRKALEQ